MSVVGNVFKTASAAVVGLALLTGAGMMVTPAHAENQEETSEERKTTDELFDACEDLDGEPTLVYNGDDLAFGTYVECVGHDEEDDVDWGWKCGEINGGLKYECEHWETPTGGSIAPFTSGFSIKESGVTKTGATQTGLSKGTLIENTDVIAKETESSGALLPLQLATNPDLFEVEVADNSNTENCTEKTDDQTSAHGPGGGVVGDAGDLPTDPEPKKPPFTSGFNISGSQPVAPVADTDPCTEPDEGDVEPTPEPVDEELAEEPEAEEPVTEPEQPVAEEPVVTEPTPEPVVDEEPKDEATNELSTNGATQDEPAADDDADETRDEVNDIRTNVARGAGVEAIGQPVQSLTEDESNGRGIGLMGILIGAGLAMPVALGAVLLRRRNG